MSHALKPDSVGRYLQRRGLVAADAPVSAVPLGGGVSNDVLAVTGPGIDLVVKQALPRLRVAQEWVATTSRVLTEADALRLAGRICPDAVPEVLDVDDVAMTLTITRANRSLRNWKSDLLAGRLDAHTAVRCGESLAQWHSATAGDTTVRDHFNNDAFVQLRVEPFHWTVAARHPDRADRITDLAGRLLATHDCLVHGDFSPKNILAGSSRVCVLDWEVAHCGDPVFDLAFLLAHLMLKAVHRPVDAAGYRGLATEFLCAYHERVDPALCSADADLAGQVACLLLARADGKSPAEYLTEPERARVRAIARDALASPGTTAGLWERCYG